MMALGDILAARTDNAHAVFYAACRELQGAGAALLRAGKVYRPDQVMALVSDAEAVRALSGWTGMDGGTAQRTDLPAGNTAGDSTGAGKAADTDKKGGVPCRDIGQTRVG